MTCTGAGTRRARWPRAVPVQGAGAHRVWFRSFHRPGPKSQPDKHAVNVRHIYEISRRAVWTIPDFLFIHRARVVFSQSAALLRAGPGSGIPSISTPRAQVQCRCPQVIHMLMHATPFSSPAAGLAASSRSASRGLRDMRGTPDARTRHVGDRPRSRPTVVTAAVQDKRAGYPPPACLPVTSSQPVRAARRRCAQVRRPVTVRRNRSHKRERDTPAPPATGLGSQPRASPLRGRGPGSSRLPLQRLPACPAGATPFRLARIRQGPSMYEMEGPCPASPQRTASCLAVPAPRAARRGQVPVRETGLPAPPTFPGVAPRWCPFPTVRHFYCIRGRRARARGQPFRVPPLSTQESTESGQLSPFHGGHPRVYSQSILSLRIRTGQHRARCHRMFGRSFISAGG
jgi:hypothetical protein